LVQEVKKSTCYTLNFHEGLWGTQLSLAKECVLDGHSEGA